MFRFLGRKRVAVPLGIVMSLAIAGAAFAYSTSTGSGTGAASVGLASPWSVTVASPSGGPLYPGSGTESLAYTVTNTGQGRQQLSSTSASVASSGGNVTHGGTPVPGCLASWFTAVNTPPTPLPNDLAGGGSTTGSIAVTMQDSGTNQDACKSVSPDISVQTPGSATASTPGGTFTGTGGSPLTYAMTTGDSGTVAPNAGRTTFDANGHDPSGGGNNVTLEYDTFPNGAGYIVSMGYSGNPPSVPMHYTFTVNGASTSGTLSPPGSAFSPVFQLGDAITVTVSVG
jgi:hypothetical protein